MCVCISCRRFRRVHPDHYQHFCSPFTCNKSLSINQPYTHPSSKVQILNVPQQYRSLQKHTHTEREGKKKNTEKTEKTDKQTRRGARAVCFPPACGISFPQKTKRPKVKEKEKTTLGGLRFVCKTYPKSISFFIIYTVYLRQSRFRKTVSATTAAAGFGFGFGFGFVTAPGRCRFRLADAS